MLMKKTCVFICGTNCTGKTTVAKALQARFGGIRATTSDTTYCNDSRACFAGRYKTDGKHGGVDVLNRTDTLAGIVKNGLQTADVVFCEGSYLDTFGQNLLNAIFAGEKQLYVFLYCSQKILTERNWARLDDKNRGGQRQEVIARMMNKQRRVLSSAKKYASIGVPVLTIDSGTTPTEAIVEQILNRLGI